MLQGTYLTMRKQDRSCISDKGLSDMHITLPHCLFDLRGYVEKNALRREENKTQSCLCIVDAMLKNLPLDSFIGFCL